MICNNMFKKILGKSSSSLNTIFLDLNVFIKKDCYRKGLIYTLYSDKLNLIEIGFAQNILDLNNKLINNKFVLLDKKVGNKFDLILMKNILSELGENLINNNYYSHSKSIMRHLYVLGWPIGNSLFKPRKIKKQLSLAVN